MRATAISPVKRVGAAKQRLLAALDGPSRAGLVRALLADVLAATSSAGHGLPVAHYGLGRPSFGVFFELSSVSLILDQNLRPACDQICSRFANRSTVESSRSGCIGFPRCTWKPASRARARSSSPVKAVTAAAGRGFFFVLIVRMRS